MIKSIQILASSQIKTLDTDTLVDLPLFGTTIGASSGKQRDISILDFYSVCNDTEKSAWE